MIIQTGRLYIGGVDTIMGVGSMKIVKAASLAFILTLSAVGSYAAETVPAADPSFNGAVPSDVPSAPKRAAAPANMESTVDPAEVKEKAIQRLKAISDYSLTLPKEKRQIYNNIVANGAFVIHKMKKGLVKPDDFDKSLKELDKLYEGDGTLTEKEAEKWFSTFKSQTRLSPRR